MKTAIGTIALKRSRDADDPDHPAGQLARDHASSARSLRVEVRDDEQRGHAEHHRHQQQQRVHRQEDRVAADRVGRLRAQVAGDEAREDGERDAVEDAGRGEPQHAQAGRLVAGQRQPLGALGAQAAEQLAVGAEQLQRQVDGQERDREDHQRVLEHAHPRAPAQAADQHEADADRERDHERRLEPDLVVGDRVDDQAHALDLQLDVGQQRDRGDDRHERAELPRAEAVGDDVEIEISSWRLA